MPKNEYRRHFPFKTIRAQQERAIETALNAFESGKKYVVCEMGTGCGKSATGVCISRYLQRSLIANPILDDNGDVVENVGSWFLTTQKVLQEQYLRDFGGPGPTAMKSIKSSTNYTCQMHEDDSDKLSCGEVKKLVVANKVFKMLYAGCQGQCKYSAEKKVFLEAIESVTNYSYFFSDSQYAKQVVPRELLVLDEAHTIEEQLSKFVEISISEKFAKQMLALKMPDSFADIEAAVSWVKTKYLKALQKKVEEYAKLLENMSDASKKIVSVKDYAQKHDVLDKHLCKVRRFISVYRANAWIMNIVPAFGQSQRKIEFKPIEVCEFTHDHLFNFGKKVLMMSATILDIDVFCQSLGLPRDEVEFIRIPSPFDAKNRPIHIVPVGSMSKSKIDETLPKMVEAVRFILDQHPNEKGIIHAVTFKIAKYLVENVGNNRLVTHDSTNRDFILKLHEESDVPSVLVSPSMMEGVDLAGDKSRFQIICKVPFPYLGDLVVQKRMKLQPSWYDYKTVMSTVQAFGRSVRNENDYAVSYVLDSDWLRFYKKNKNMFPLEFIEAIKEG
jgi:Rad3-related DNA helicase